MKALRFNDGKPDLSYLLEFPKAMALFCNICKFGEYKYGRLNFKRGGKPDLEYYQSALRHLQAAYAGEEFDPDSGLHHLGHAMWNFITLVEINVEETMRFEDHAAFIKYCEETAEKYRALRERALDNAPDSGVGGEVLITVRDGAGNPVVEGQDQDAFKGLKSTA